MPRGFEPILVRAPNPGLLTIDGTNTWVIPGSIGALVVDPGPSDWSHVASFVSHGPVAGVLLSHGHNDHSGALENFSPDKPVFAGSEQFASNADPVNHGQRIEIGSIALNVLHTPGHSADSVCFIYEDASDGPVVFTGDTLLGGRHASYIPRVGGMLSDYLDSLSMLTNLSGYRGLPGHGPTIPDVAAHAHQALDYRRHRLEQLASHLAVGGSTDPEEIARERHPDRPDRRRPAAGMLLAELRYLGVELD